MPVPPAGALRLTSADFDAFLEPTTGVSAVPPASMTSSAPRSSGDGSPQLASRDSRGLASQRRALRERIEAWARGLLPRLTELGVAVEIVVPDEVEPHLSSRTPRTNAERVLFVRDGYARSLVPRTEPDLDPLRSHAFLALTIDSVHVAVSLEVCPEAEADVKNTRARIADPTALLELVSLLESMPDEFAIGVIGVPSFPRARDATADDVRALLDDSHRSRRALWIGWSVKREMALAHAEELDELLADALVALAHAYKLLAWAPDNDLIAASRRGAWRARRARVEERRERGREERRTRQQSAGKGTARKEGSRREREDERRFRAADPDASATSRRDDGREPEPSPKSDALPARVSPVACRPPPARRPILQTSLRARGGPTHDDVDPSLPIDKGVKVRVLAGPFANRTGVVQELDPKDRARVRLGLLVVSIDLEDLAVVVEASRPKLASSHRRPKGTRGS